MLNEKDEGGLGILDIETRIQAMRTKYVLNFIDISFTLNASVAMYWLLLPMRKLFNIESFRLILYLKQK